MEKIINILPVMIMIFFDLLKDHIRKKKKKVFIKMSKHDDLA